MRQSNFWKDSGLGELFMTGIPGTKLDKETLNLVKDYGISKFILFSRNTKKGPRALKKLCKDIKKTCLSHGLTPLIAIDQEGGPVRRLSPPDFSDMPSQTSVRRAQEPEKAIYGLAMATVKILKKFYIDINLAPVLDLCLQGEKNVLKERCFGKISEKVARLGAIYVNCLERNGIKSTAKHFPGIGRVECDPHHYLPTVTADKETILHEAVPFKAAIEAGTSCIMTSHVVFQDIDPEKPATFSHQIATELLRNNFGFSGVLMSDDLEMKGALTQTDTARAALFALMAGHDLLLVCSNHTKLRLALLGLREAWQKGNLPPHRIDEARERLARLCHQQASF